MTRVSPRLRDGFARYAIAIVVVGLTLGIKLLFFGLGSDHPFVLLPAAVAVAAWDWSDNHATGSARHDDLDVTQGDNALRLP